MTLWEELQYRGVVKDVAGEEELVKKLNDEKITFYWGTDPTADSLHIGHYSSLVTAKRLAMHGHHAILLVGGATGLIGDPRPTAEREIISYETLNANVKKLEANKLYKIKIVVEKIETGRNIKAYVDGELYYDYTDTSPLNGTIFGIRCKALSDNSAPHKISIVSCKKY